MLVYQRVEWVEGFLGGMWAEAPISSKDQQNYSWCFFFGGGEIWLTTTSWHGSNLPSTTNNNPTNQLSCNIPEFQVAV